jgi:DNA-directed RNA polymerase subunit M/transcription elongation factor TFIIS
MSDPSPGLPQICPRCDRETAGTVALRTSTLVYVCRCGQRWTHDLQPIQPTPDPPEPSR